MFARTRQCLALLCCLAAGLAGGRAFAAGDDCAPHLRAQLNMSPLGAPLVTLTVNGAPANLLLDTGAERSILTAAAAAAGSKRLLRRMLVKCRRAGRLAAERRRERPGESRGRSG